ncbi:hypothetical protein FDJ25_gp084 [Vibrio phage Aphrodite1]|uniref:Uncharacterized protein n=1 Tax=Vibrio phage Aphrodite1 TaxID=2070057 RepID=A0A2I7QI56_9CAUD|nr:hypothetical protein FDJ25_gp084 [Vibrio phage Aphrodite1]AUR81082.1 hypothetical protein Aphrodite1_0119 [Vibrio phage Aphrodite1]
MSPLLRNIKLNLLINTTYYSLFTEVNSLKLLANLFLEDHPNNTQPPFSYDELPEWKEELIESLHQLLKTEDEGRRFGEQLILNFSEGYTLEETTTSKNFVQITFCLRQEPNHDNQG